MRVSKFLFFTSILLVSMEGIFAQEKTQRPNIVFIMADDHAYQAISAYNKSFIHTPNIDRIANKGVLFTNASVTNSLCAPSRATILTGKHSHLNGKIDNVFEFDTTNITFPQLLQRAGYQTAMFGKLHFGNNPKGFDEFKILPGQGFYYNPEFITKKNGKIKMEGYVTDLITDMTLDWLDNDRKENEPFLLMYLHKAPHREWFPAQRHLEEFTQKTFPIPPTLFDDYSGHGKSVAQAEMNILKHMGWAGDNKLNPAIMKELGIEGVDEIDISRYAYLFDRLNPNQRKTMDYYYDIVGEKFKEAFPRMTEKDKMIWKYQRYMQDYLATIKAVDENVGRVLDYLESHDLMQNTIIVYTSDQGFYLGEHGWFDKRFIYDESFRTPLMIAWPGIIKEARRSSKMVQNLDFAQTFLEAAGVEAPIDMQGESMLSMLKNGDQEWTREEVYYHYYEFPAVHWVNRHYGIVTEDFKLIHYYFADEEWELIDRKNDPMELKNVFYDPKYTLVKNKMMEKLKEVREKYQDNDEISQKYINEYMQRVKKSNENSTNPSEKNQKIIEIWENNH